MTDNFQALDDTRHMLQWLADEPYEEIRSSVESILREQVADSRLIDFAVTSEPDWLTVGTRSPDNPDAIILNRTATAFEFCLHVSGAAKFTNCTVSTLGRHGISTATAKDQTNGFGSI